MAGRKGDVQVIVALALLSVVLTWPLVLHLGDHVGHDPYDPLYNVWAMSWDLKALSSGPAEFAQANIFFPHRGTLFYADTVVGLALLGAPWRALSGNPILAYNLLFILSFFVRGLGMYLLAKHLVRSRPGAFLAALIFAFFPYNLAHISHLEIISFGWIPLCFLFIHRFFEKPTWGNAFGVGLFFTLQLLTCAYYGEYLGFAAGLLFLVSAVRTGAWRRAGFWARTAGLAALIGAVLGPYLYGYLAVHGRMLFERPLWEIKQFSAELQHFLASAPWSVVWGRLTGTLGNQETQLYLGIVPVVLTVLGIVWKRTDVRRTADPDSPGRRPRGFRWWDGANVGFFLFILAVGLTGGFSLDLGITTVSAHNLKKPFLVLLVSLVVRWLADRTLRRRAARFLRSLEPAQRFYAGLTVASWLLAFGPVIRVLGREVIAGPYAFLYNWIPGFKGLRVPGRFVVLVMLGLALSSAAALAAWHGRVGPGRRRTFLTAGLCLAVLVDFAAVPIPLVKVETGKTLPSIYLAVRALPPGAVLIELPMPARDAEEYHEAIPTYRSTFHWRKLVNGYSGYSPPAYRVVREAMEKFPDRWTLDLLENLGVEYVLVHTREFRPDKGRASVSRLAEFSERAELVEERNGDYLYRLLPWRAGHPGPSLPSGGRPVGNRALWKAQASKNAPRVGRAFDGDPKTFWSTGYPQQEGDFFHLDLGQLESFSRVEFLLEDQPLDYPRNFVVEASADGSAWTTLDRGVDYFPPLRREMVEDFSQYKVLASLSPGRARYLRFRLLAPHEARHWSIAEILLVGD